MSTKRSKIWTSRRDQLQQKESELRGELDEASDEIESQVKNIAKVALIAGGALLVGYGLYRIFRKKEEEYEEPEPPAPKAKSLSAPARYEPWSFKRIFMERLASTLVKVVGAQLAILLAQKLGSKPADDEGED